MSGPFRRAVYQVTGNEIILRFADGKKSQIKELVSRRIRKDVDTEIDHAARQYGRFALGGAGRVQGPQSGTQTTAVRSAESEDTTGRMGGWHPRGKEYLARKRRRSGHIKWFVTTGKTRQALSGKGVWQAIYGGTKVRVTIHSETNREVGQAFAQRGTGYLRTTLATINVGALPQLSAQFGNVGRKLWQYDEDLAHHVLGRRKYYRPTMEPFLKFVVNKAVPEAVGRRMAAGLSGSIHRELEATP